MMSQTALKYDVEVQADGRVELQLPFPSGSHVVIFVLAQEDPLQELMTAAQSSLEFWDNPLDDEDWNNA